MAKCPRKMTLKEKLAMAEAEAPQEPVAPTLQVIHEPNQDQEEFASPTEEQMAAAIQAVSLQGLINAAIEESGDTAVHCVHADGDVLHFSVRSETVPLVTSQPNLGAPIMANATTTNTTAAPTGIDDILAGFQNRATAIENRLSALETNQRAATHVSINSGAITDYSLDDMTGRVATGALTGVGLAIGATAVAAGVQLARNMMNRDE